MFGLIGHSTSLEAARSLAERLGFPEYAAGDLEMWCSAPPQLVERFEVVSATGARIEGAYIDSVFVPEMLRRFKTAKRKVLNAMELAQKSGLHISALGGFTSIIFEDMNLLREQQVRGRADRQKLGNTLYKTQNHRLERGHVPPHRRHTARIPGHCQRRSVITVSKCRVSGNIS